MKTDLVTVTYNSKNNLETFFESIKNNINSFEKIIFVDNNSSDDTLKEINFLSEKLNIKNISIIKNKKNYGYAHAINIGIKESVNSKISPLILVTNNDVIFSKNSIEKMINESTDLDSDVTGMVITNDHINFKTGYNTHEKSYKKEEIKNNLAPKEIGFAHGGVILFKKSFFEKIGLYDSELFFGGDEMDFFFRVKKYNKNNKDKIKCFCAFSTLDNIDHISKHDSRYKLKKATRMLQGSARVYMKHLYSPLSAGLYKEQLKEIKLLSKNNPIKIIILSILSIRGLVIESFKYYL